MRVFFLMKNWESAPDRSTIHYVDVRSEIWRKSPLNYFENLSDYHMFYDIIWCTSIPLCVCNFFCSALNIMLWIRRDYQKIYGVFHFSEIQRNIIFSKENGLFLDLYPWIQALTCKKTLSCYIMLDLKF